MVTRSRTHLIIMTCIKNERFTYSCYGGKEKKKKKKKNIATEIKFTPI